jgi:hypothetical protein
MPIIRPTKEHLKAGIVTEDMDFPLFRYNLSLKGRINMVNNSFQNIKVYNEESIKEVIESKSKPVGSSLSSQNQFALIQSFESFVDQVHKTMETIGSINLFIFPIPWDDLTSNEWRNIGSFNYQRKMILAEELSFGADYRQIMANMDWFDELRDLRDNSNHSMSGLPVHEIGENKEPILLYYVHICLGRPNAKTGVIQYPIVDKTEQYYREFHLFLERIGQYYLKTIDPDKRVQLPFLKDGKMTFIELSINEFLRSENLVIG